MINCFTMLLILMSRMSLFQEPSGTYIVLYSYAAQDENDLGVERGQCVTVSQILRLIFVKTRGISKRCQKDDELGSCPMSPLAGPQLRRPRLVLGVAVRRRRGLRPGRLHLPPRRASETTWVYCVQICNKSQRIGCVIPHCKLQCGITQLHIFWHVCM